MCCSLCAPRSPRAAAAPSRASPQVCLWLRLLAQSPLGQSLMPVYSSSRPATPPNSTRPSSASYPIPNSTPVSASRAPSPTANIFPGPPSPPASPPFSNPPSHFSCRGLILPRSLSVVTVVSFLFALSAQRLNQQLFLCFRQAAQRLQRCHVAARRGHRQPRERHCRYPRISEQSAGKDDHRADCRHHNLHAQSGPYRNPRIPLPLHLPELHFLREAQRRPVRNRQLTRHRERSRPNRRRKHRRARPPYTPH